MADLGHLWNLNPVRRRLSEACRSADMSHSSRAWAKSFCILVFKLRVAKTRNLEFADCGGATNKSATPAARATDTREPIYQLANRIVLSQI